MPDAREERRNGTFEKKAAKDETFDSDVLYGFRRNLV